MTKKLPRKIVIAGGILIVLSGILNTILGIQISAVYYYPYPGGKMGHVGIIAGLIAILIGLAIIFLLPHLYESRYRILRLLGGLLTAVLGHAGAVFGALYVGTAGVVICYIGAIWLLIQFTRDRDRTHSP